MGRKMLEIRYITDLRKWKSTRQKRKVGLSKKAYEFAILTGCRVRLSISTGDGEETNVYGEGATTPLEAPAPVQEPRPLANVPAIARSLPPPQTSAADTIVVRTPLPVSNLQRGEPASDCLDLLPWSPFGAPETPVPYGGGDDFWGLSGSGYSPAPLSPFGLPFPRLEGECSLPMLGDSFSDAMLAGVCELPLLGLTTDDSTLDANRARESDLPALEWTPGLAWGQC